MTVDPRTGREPSRKQRTRASSRSRSQGGRGGGWLREWIRVSQQNAQLFQVSLTSQSPPLLYLEIYSPPPAVATAGAESDICIVAEATEGVVVTATAAGTNVTALPTAAALGITATAFDTAASADRCCVTQHTDTQAKMWRSSTSVSIVSIRGQG